MIKLTYQQTAKKGIWYKTFEHCLNKCTSYTQVKADYVQSPQTVRSELDETNETSTAIITQSRPNKNLNMLRNGMGRENSWHDADRGDRTVTMRRKVDVVTCLHVALGHSPDR
jgi:hypothetical protein